MKLGKGKECLTGNKGEWSEMYTLLKLLGEGEVYAGDENLNKIKDLFYPIVKILREEANYQREGDYVEVLTEDNTLLLCIPANDFIEQAEYLLSEIKENSGAFSVAETEAFMHKIHCSALKAKSSDKTDIRIILHDRRTKMNSEMGFSIKSQLGGDSTILNAGKTTNFNYKIVGRHLSDKDIAKINAIDTSRTKVIDRANAIKALGCTLVFDKMDSRAFGNNLTMLDSCMPELVASLLLAQLDTGVSGLKKLVETVSRINPLDFDVASVPQIYEYKVKHLLTSVALGMMPGTVWNGKFDANGGYLVVRKDGEVVCYHFYDRNRFEDYLFNNAYLERASTTRHEYASIVKENDGSLSFKLNLQIRLK